MTREASVMASILLSNGMAKQKEKSSYMLGMHSGEIKEQNMEHSPKDVRIQQIPPK